MNNLPMIARTSQPESMQISDCVVEASPQSVSPISEFESSLASLVRLSATMASSPDPNIVGEMLIVAAVASVEAYFRGLLATMAHVCPITASNIGQESVTIEAVRSYPPTMAVLATVEQSLFSSRGVIEAQIKRFTKFAIPKQSELAAALAAFESACDCRHSIAHWRGYLSSRTMVSLGLNERTSKRYQLDTNYDLVQRVLASADYLVHVANQVLFEVTVRKWIDGGLLVLADASDVDDRRQISNLLPLFASEARPGGRLTPAKLQREMVAAVASPAPATTAAAASAPSIPDANFVARVNPLRGMRVKHRFGRSLKRK